MTLAAAVVCVALAATPPQQRPGDAALVPAPRSHRHEAAADPLAISMVAAKAAAEQALMHSALQRRNALRRAMACYDADSFTDSKGVTCAGWASVNCSKPPASCGYFDPYESERIRKACPVTCGECSVITAGGDPVLKHNGRFVKFSLAPNRLTTLVSWLSKNGDRLSILGATLSHPTRTDNQWFNEIQLMVNATRVLRLSVEQPDVSMKVELDGQDLPFPVKCTWKELVKGRCMDDNTDTQNRLKEFASVAGHLSFTWSDLKEKKVADRKAKKILALFGPMGMELIFAKAAKFESKVAQNAYAHFNIKLMGVVPKHVRPSRSNTESRPSPRNPPQPAAHPPARPLCRSLAHRLPLARGRRRVCS